VILHTNQAYFPLSISSAFRFPFYSDSRNPQKIFYGGMHSQFDGSEQSNLLVFYMPECHLICILENFSFWYIQHSLCNNNSNFLHLKHFFWYHWLGIEEILCNTRVMSCRPHDATADLEVWCLKLKEEKVKLLKILYISKNSFWLTRNLILVTKCIRYSIRSNISITAPNKNTISFNNAVPNTRK